MPRDRGPSILTMALTLVGVVAAVAIGIMVAINLFGAVNGTLSSSPAAARLDSSAATTPPVVALEPLDMRPDPVGSVAATTTLVVPAARAAKPAPKSAAAKNGWVVVIDPGHQAQANLHQEPIGPGSSQTKPAVAGGATGSVTRIPEHTINLRVSLKLRDALQARGVKVVMVRTTEDVNVPNSERALLANRNHADLFIRIHCDGVSGSSTNGLSTQVPAANQWTGPIVAPSRRAGEFIQSAAISATGAHDRGLVPRADMTGFNWAKVPTVIVEMGFLSNPTEDRKLATPSYQDKLARGISGGIMSYLQSTAR